MKRFLISLLCLGMAFSLAACAGQTEPTIPETEPAETVVCTVDELLSALEPGARIQLAAETFYLTEASDYGEETDSPYYQWVDTFDGYELKLTGLTDVHIFGSGMGNTVLCAISRNAEVLTLKNCSDITLEAMTLGHTLEKGSCGGGVLKLQGCSNINMTGLGLYGCGVTGLQVQMSSHVTISDSDIYDCSDSGIVAEETDNLLVDGCRIYDLGDKIYGGYAVFSLTNNSGITITGCQIRDNVVRYLVTGYPGEGIVMRSNVITDNRVRETALDLYDNKAVFADNTLRDNHVRGWYLFPDIWAVDASGEPVTEEWLQEANVLSGADEKETARREVRVSTVDELLAAIGPDTQIILEGEHYNLSEATGYGETSGDYYCWQESYDGPELVIMNVYNFGISSSDGKEKAHTISAVPRYANVLTFAGCRDISLSGFTAGHTLEAGVCAGGVIRIQDCEEMRVENCGLFGCGILGIQAEYSYDIQVLKCDIYECSEGGIRMSGVDGVNIKGCIFRDLGGPKMSFTDCNDVTVNGKKTDGYALIE